MWYGNVVNELFFSPPAPPSFKERERFPEGTGQRNADSRAGSTLPRDVHSKDVVRVRGYRDTRRHTNYPRARAHAFIMGPWAVATAHTPEGELGV